MRRIALLFAACCLSGLALSCAALRAQNNDKLSLVWYGVIRNASVANPSSRPLVDSAFVMPGEGLQLFLSVKPAAFVYVIHQSPSGELTAWWPSQASGFNAFLEGERVLTLPARGRLYSLQPSQGIDAIYLIASFKPINTVEKLTREIHWLFAAAQAYGTGVPDRQVRESLPKRLTWRITKYAPIKLTSQRIPIATTVKCIGNPTSAAREVVETTDGARNEISPEQIRGGDVVARVIRLYRRTR
jgi:hypothetical protein